MWRARLVAHLRVLIDRAGRRRTSRAGAAILLGNAAERLLDVGTGEVVELERLEEAFDLIEELGCGECAVV